MDIDGGGVG